MLHNCRIKRFPDGSADICIGSRPFGGGSIVREPSRYDDDAPSIVEENHVRSLHPTDQESAYASLEREAIIYDGTDDVALLAKKRASVARSMRRARVRVRDLGMCNDFKFFVTLTLDQSKIDRYDPKEIIRHLNHWLDNNVRRFGLIYVLVPEHHKDGAIHFHGFFNDALEAVDSGHKDRKGHTIYNLPGWGWGFSTGIKLYGEKAAAVAYVCKYISKEYSKEQEFDGGRSTPRQKIGGRWYYSGGDLKRPEIEWTDADFQAALDAEGGVSFEIEATGIQFVSVRSDRTYVSRETGGGDVVADCKQETAGDDGSGPARPSGILRRPVSCTTP